jgi:hypothetical protein
MRNTNLGVRKLKKRGAVSGFLLGSIALTNVAGLYLATNYQAAALLQPNAEAQPFVDELSFDQTLNAAIDKGIEISSVPFYSQFSDITAAEWRGVSCGVASLAMLIDYFTDPVTPDDLLQRGLAAGAFNDAVGWSHAGLIALANEHGLDGETVWLSADKQQALNDLAVELENGPVMASVHYTFDPANPIPHLVVISAVNDDNTITYSDPAELSGNRTLDTDQFLRSWKNRYIKIRPIV